MNIKSGDGVRLNRPVGLMTPFADFLASRGDYYESKARRFFAESLSPRF